MLVYCADGSGPFSLGASMGPWCVRLYFAAVCHTVLCIPIQMCRHREADVDTHDSTWKGNRCEHTGTAQGSYLIMILLWWKSTRLKFELRFSILYASQYFERWRMDFIVHTHIILGILIMCFSVGSGWACR